MRPFSFRYISFAGLVAALLLASSAHAQQPPPGKEKSPRNFSDKTTEAFAKLKPLQDAKDWDGMIALLDSIPAEPTSYDKAIILDMKAKAYLQKDDLLKAAVPWEAALKLADQFDYFNKNDTLQVVFFLAQIYFQEGAALKNPVTQAEYFGKSAAFIKRWLQDTPKVTPEAQLFYAQILYSQAVVNPEKIDLNLVKLAQSESEKGLRTSIKPRELFYVLILASYQQQNDYVRAAEVMELLVSQYPNNKNYWGQLWPLYLNLAANFEKEGARDQDKARAYYARAVNAIERAQAVGQLKTPKDNYALVTIYFSAGQFGRATDLLYAGLKSGGIENDIKNWQILAYSYQQVNQEFKAIEVLKEAAVQFPTIGQIDFSIALIYNQLDKPKEAYEFYKSAIKKGNIEKPLNAYINLAYTCYELGLIDEAKSVIDEAAKIDAEGKDKTIPRLRAAIEAQIAERDANREAIDGKTKAPPATDKPAPKKS